MSIGSGPTSVGLACLVSICLGSTPVQGQSGNPGPLSQTGTGAVLSPTTIPTQPTTATADTALARLTGPATWPSPEHLTVWPDTVAFGGVLTVTLDFPTGTQDLSSDDLFSQVPWLVWADSFGPERQTGFRGFWERWVGRWFGQRVGSAKAPPVKVENLPPATGTRIQRQARIFRTGPYRLQWQDGEHAAGLSTTVLQVASGLATGDEPLGVRNPRSLGWRWLLLLTILLVVILLMAFLTWLRRRGRGTRPGLEHTPVPPPAYLGVARQLWTLHAEELPVKGEGRRFLDRLAAQMRAYLRDRFRIGADEMTASEILTALRKKGYRADVNRRFAEVLQEVDALRYSPERVSQLRCDELLARTVALMDEVKVVARFTTVPAELAVAGEKSWGRLTAWLHDNTRLSSVAVGEDA